MRSKGVLSSEVFFLDFILCFNECVYSGNLWPSRHCNLSTDFLMTNNINTNS